MASFQITFKWYHAQSIIHLQWMLACIQVLMSTYQHSWTVTFISISSSGVRIYNWWVWHANLDHLLLYKVLPLNVCILCFPYWNTKNWWVRWTYPWILMGSAKPMLTPPLISGLCQGPILTMVAKLCIFHLEWLCYFMLDTLLYLTRDTLLYAWYHLSVIWKLIPHCG